jgi:hypothetical protein
MKKRYDKELSIEALAAIPDDQIDTFRNSATIFGNMQNWWSRKERSK